MITVCLSSRLLRLFPLKHAGIETHRVCMEFSSQFASEDFYGGRIVVLWFIQCTGVMIREVLLRTVGDSGWDL